MRHLSAPLLSTLLVSLLAMPVVSAQIMYTGTYTRGASKGIYAYRFDNKTGKLSPLGLMAETPSPSFVAVHPSGKYLYAVNEIDKFENKAAGSVSAFAIDRNTGKLTFLNAVSSGGPGPCHVVVDNTGKAVLVANYGGGSFASFPVHPDGKLGEAATFLQSQGSSVDKQRQTSPHGHSMYVTRNNKFVLAADLGTDKIMLYKLDPATAKITPANPPFATGKPGAGPRHLAIAPDQKHVYVLNEMGSSVSVFSLDAAAGALKAMDTVSALPADFKGQSSGAEIQIDDRGRFVYSSNRGHDSIAVFAVDPKTAGIKLVGTTPSGGKTPRAFVLDPTGNWLIAGNQDTNNIAVFRIDHATGKLTQTGDKVELGAPVSFAFVK